MQPASITIVRKSDQDFKQRQLIVWLNGERIGAHEQGEMGWDERFEFDVTNKLRRGDNQLTVCVFDRTGPGGVWKSVKLLSSR